MSNDSWLPIELDHDEAEFVSAFVSWWLFLSPLTLIGVWFNFFTVETALKIAIGIPLVIILFVVWAVIAITTQVTPRRGGYL